MVISPVRDDFFAVMHLLGRLILGLSLFLLIPLFVAGFQKEIAPFYDFLIAFLLTACIGFILSLVFPLRREVSLLHTFFIVSLSWLSFSLLGAIPFYLSSHWRCFLDAWFEAMSGVTTTGLVLVEDLDHLSFAHNTWRHLTMFIGGQGIILVTLSMLTRAHSGSLGLYFGEGRQEKILPNIIDTARFIWKVSFLYLCLGAVVLSSLLYNIGLPFKKAIFHSLWLFFASFDTGGFAPYSQNIGYYHSLWIELGTMVFMILGAMNFNLHFWVWLKDKKELVRDFEIRTFFFTFFSSLTLLFFSLKGEVENIFRKGFYQLLSAHTGCGFTNLSRGELIGLGNLSLIAIIFVMAIGGGMCSTTGGIKLMRIGLIFKSFFMEIKRWMMPHKAIYKEKFHHFQNLTLDDKKVKEIFIYFTLFLFTYLGGAVMGVLCGYPPLLSLLESVSATANVGLSSGITQPSMPTILKLTYILQMWMGRLEFLSIFVSIGFTLSIFKK